MVALDGAAQLSRIDSVEELVQLIDPEQCTAGFLDVSSVLHQPIQLLVLHLLHYLRQHLEELLALCPVI